MVLFIYVNLLISSIRYLQIFRALVLIILTELYKNTGNLHTAFYLLLLSLNLILL